MERAVKLILASGNAGKLAELRRLLEPLGIDLESQAALGIAPAAETRSTFVENALDKARHASRESGLPALADDSGLVVPMLGGAPGIRSARYAGDDADDDANNAKLIAALGDAREPAAHFYCALVLLRHPEDPAPLVATGRWDGRILGEPRGDGGFGYDPLFLVPGAGCTAAELPAAEKNRLSHRGQAMAMLLESLRAEV
ncbi:MAG: non-canonical purine NTP pyrophosphatase, RdgB/HAM1 family [Gammaproteobacteria bacterium]|nr:non-canonical purine NTP pyrophosphatase, RdgB/HAM1 family [Gammaproteobacteria bacterium]MBK79485.1 non-canonical purine NTP pyrophosphatase, RdgB/HAM1 family [Gammaproteobacteria bacterium]